MTAEMDEMMAAALRAPFPPEQIGKLPRITCRDCRGRNANCSKHQRRECPVCGGCITTAHIHLDYVGHAAVTDRLLAVDPWWGWEPVAVDDHGRPLLDPDGALWIRLTVGGVTRLGVGHADGKTGPDAMKEAIGDAIRNAAMRFGVALDLWSKEQLRPDAPTVEPAHDDRPATTIDAKRAVLDLCDGNRDLAREAWDRHGADLDAIEAWLHEPREDSRPDDGGVAGRLQQPVGDSEQTGGGDNVDSAPGVDGTPPPAASGKRLSPAQKAMHAKVGELVAAGVWPKADADMLRKGVISAISAGRTDSSHDLDGDAMSDVLDALDAVASGYLEVRRRATGEWSIDPARKRREAS